MAVLLLNPALWSCNKNSPTASDPPSGPAAPVTVAAVESRDVPVELRAVATVEPYSTVTIRPQVAGQITTVHITEGQDVKTGDPLFTIDPRPFEAALRQAEATLARDEALARDAEADALRQDELYKQGLANQREYEVSQALAASRRAIVKADQASADEARLDLEYCSIRSPIDGRTGRLLVNAGNIVKANETALLVVNQIHPIYVEFNLPERHLGEIRHYGAGEKLSVQVLFPEGGSLAMSNDSAAESGVLSFIDNTVDRSTGVIALRATLANEQSRLWPGQYVNTVLTLTTLQGVLVVPSEAVQTGPSGSFVYVVKEDLTVEARAVTVALTHQGRKVVTAGLQAGERVVIDGQLRLSPGARVEIKNQPTTRSAQP